MPSKINTVIQPLTLSINTLKEELNTLKNYTQTLVIEQNNLIDKNKILNNDINHIKNLIPNPSILKNIINKATITVNQWDTDPTNLSNCTDGNISTSTGTGSTVKAGAGYFGEIIFTFPSPVSILLGGVIGLWSNASYGQIYYKVDGELSCSTQSTTNWTTTEKKFHICPKLLYNITSLSIMFRILGAATCYGKIYEIYTYEVN